MIWALVGLLVINVFSLAWEGVNEQIIYDIDHFKPSVGYLTTSYNLSLVAELITLHLLSN